MTITKNVWKAAALLLILCLVSTVMISGTYAKYTSEFVGQDTALVAKWNVVASGGGVTIADGETRDLNLFEHSDTNVATTPGAYIIAPGVGGSFTLEFTNNSDVTANMKFAIATTGSVSVPIVYTYKSKNYTETGDATHNLTALAADMQTEAGNLAINGSTEVTVTWAWPYVGNDAADTLLGTGSAISTDPQGRSNYGLRITATAEQVD